MTKEYKIRENGVKRLKQTEGLLIEIGLRLRNEQALGPTWLNDAAMAMMSRRHKLAIVPSAWLPEREASTSGAVSLNQGLDALLAMHGALVHMYVCPT